MKTIHGKSMYTFFYGEDKINITAVDLIEANNYVANNFPGFKLLSIANFPDLNTIYRINETWELSGESCPPPFPQFNHVHQWDSDGYCSICGADGAA